MHVRLIIRTTPLLLCMIGRLGMQLVERQLRHRALRRVGFIGCGGGGAVFLPPRHLAKQRQHAVLRFQRSTQAPRLPMVSAPCVAHASSLPLNIPSFLRAFPATAAALMQQCYTFSATNLIHQNLHEL